MLQVEDVTTRYGAITALRDVSMHVDEGEVVALIGPNGAGKTTLLGSVVGLLRPAAGRVRFRGTDVTGAAPDAMLRAGMALVPEHRRIFADLTVEENLAVGGVTLSQAQRRDRIEQLCDRFPILGERRRLHAGYLSGGQAQQLALARALMTDPALLLMDEPSLGLAPAPVDGVFDLIEELRAQGRTMLVVEQNATRVLGVADRAYVLRSGAVVDEGPADRVLSSDVFETYIGLRADEAHGGAVADAEAELHGGAVAEADSDATGDGRG